MLHVTRQPVPDDRKKLGVGVVEGGDGRTDAQVLTRVDLDDLGHGTRGDVHQRRVGAHDLLPEFGDAHLTTVRAGHEAYVVGLEGQLEAGSLRRCPT